MRVYYNEYDKHAAQWLRNLIAAQLIPGGIVDDRPIQEVRATDLAGFRRVHFFAGIAGWELALQLAEWPDDLDVWTGSCPCQPFSVAGRGLGVKDERHVWPFFLKLIAECRPPRIFGEQVASKAGRSWLAGVRSDLEALGYGVGASDLCAAGVGAPHIRQRLYWLADAKREGSQGPGPAESHGGQSLECGLRHGGMADAKRAGLQGPLAGRDGRLGSGGLAESAGDCVRDGRDESLGLGDSERLGLAGELRGGAGSKPTDGRPNDNAWERAEIIVGRDGKARRIEPGTAPLAHGVPGRVVKLRAYGNAIVPQLAAEFIRASREALNL